MLEEDTKEMNIGDIMDKADRNIIRKRARCDNEKGTQ